MLLFGPLMIAGVGKRLAAAGLIGIEGYPATESFEEQDRVDGDFANDIVGQACGEEGNFHLRQSPSGGAHQETEAQAHR